MRTRAKGYTRLQGGPKPARRLLRYTPATMNVMTIRSRFFLLALSLAGMLASGWATANDIAREVRAGRDQAASYDGGFLELGLVVEVFSNPLMGLSEEDNGVDIGIALNGEYQWRGLFVEANTESERGLVLGYNLARGERWLLDIIGSNQHDEISEDMDDRLEGLRDRELDFMLGLRSTHYFGSNIFQLEWMRDISDRHEGVAVNASLGKFWQVRNWNVHAILTYRHKSARVMEYYVGVREDEVTDRFSAYSPGAGHISGLEVGITLPLSEKWILRSTAQYFALSDAMSESPLATEDAGGILLTSVTRVFN